jgi:hypothetical protein
MSSRCSCRRACARADAAVHPPLALPTPDTCAKRVPPRVALARVSGSRTLFRCPPTCCAEQPPDLSFAFAAGRAGVGGAAEYYPPGGLEVGHDVPAGAGAPDLPVRGRHETYLRACCRNDERTQRRNLARVRRTRQERPRSLCMARHTPRRSEAPGRMSIFWAARQSVSGI